MRRHPLVATAALVIACTDDPTAVEPPTGPSIVLATVAASPANVLSAVVSVTVRDADSVAVRFRPADQTTGEDSMTPAVIPADDSADVPILGLYADRDYFVRVVAFSGEGTVTGEVLELTTGTLPVGLPTYSAGGVAPSPGYVVFAAGEFGVAIDNSGRVVWYHYFPRGPGLNFQAQPTGRYVARPNPAIPSQPEPWVEIDPLGTVTRTLGCARGLQPRFHDFIAARDGSYWIMCDEARTMDLSTVGGLPSAQVLGTVIQHMSAAGDLLFEWSAFDHFAITDLPLSARTGQNVNWTHGNALDVGDDGDLVVSFRSLNEITKIDVPTGAIRWRMGGLRNQFTFPGVSLPPFSGQHGIRLVGGAGLLLLDNLGEPGTSRTEHYAYDAESRTVELIAAYGPTPAVIGALGGTTQPLPGGGALVSYGNAGRVEEYDASGRLVWEVHGNPGFVFRAQRIRSLYRPGVELRR